MAGFISAFYVLEGRVSRALDDIRRIKRYDAAGPAIESLLANNEPASYYIWVNRSFKERERFRIPFSEHIRYKSLPHQAIEDSEYHLFIEHHDPTIVKVAEYLASEPESKEQAAAAIMDYVQFWIGTLPAKDYTAEEIAYLEYPLETIIAGSGLCNKKSVLAASLLMARGIDAVLLASKGATAHESHMAVGIRGDFEGDSFPYQGSSYFYAETTARFAIGKIPDEFKGREFHIIPLN